MVVLLSSGAEFLSGSGAMRGFCYQRQSPWNGRAPRAKARSQSMDFDPGAMHCETESQASRRGQAHGRWPSVLSNADEGTGSRVGLLWPFGLEALETPGAWHCRSEDGRTGYPQRPITHKKNILIPFRSSFQSHCHLQ